MDFFDRVMSSIEYHPGVHETFEELKKQGYKTALISGGFKAQADRARCDLRIDHVFAACELFWTDEGNLLHWNLLPCDYEGKLDFMKLIIKEHGLKPEECAFVGDGKNDIPLAKAVGLSIAFNADPELQKVCTHAINQPDGKEDFRGVLRIIGCNSLQGLSSLRYSDIDKMEKEKGSAQIFVDTLKRFRYI